MENNNINDTKKKLCYVLMLFDTSFNLGYSNTPDIWLNYDNIYFDNGRDALIAYTDTTCPAPQLIIAKDDEQLKELMGEMMLNFSDKEWREKYLYPNL